MDHRGWAVSLKTARRKQPDFLRPTVTLGDVVFTYGVVTV